MSLPVVVAVPRIGIDNCRMLAQPLPSVLACHADAIADLCRQFGVRRLQAFGSAATGRFEAGRSDFDFLVELDDAAGGSRAERLVGLGDALEALLAAKVDLVNPAYIRNPFFAAEVERTRLPVYG